MWGRQVAQDIGLIRNVVQKYEPDIILVLLGFNDMGWFVSDADGTLNSMVRTANPEHTTIANGYSTGQVHSRGSQGQSWRHDGYRRRTTALIDWWPRRLASQDNKVQQRLAGLAQEVRQCPVSYQAC